jgi:hypothetical protein
MKRYLLPFALAVLLTVAVAACKSSPPLEALVRQVVSDGVVTPAEVQSIQEQLPSAFDWMGAMQVVGTIAGSILGVKLLPTRALQGPFDPQPPSQPIA